MSATRSDTAEVIVRIGKALLIYLVIGGAVFGAILWLTGDFENASLTLRTQFAEADDAEASVMAILDQARLHLLHWMFVSMVISLICAGIFLAVAQRTHPRNPKEGASQKVLWILLTILMLGASGVFWWRFVSVADVSSVLLSNSYAAALGLVGVGTLLAYYLATALAVTLTMKPSVPLGTLLPDFWN